MKIYIAELDRFGYTLTCVGLNPMVCEKEILKEYVRAYRERNDGLTPGRCFSRDDDKSDYAMAKEDISISETTIGEVEWR